MRIPRTACLLIPIVLASIAAFGQAPPRAAYRRRHFRNVDAWRTSGCRLSDRGGSLG